MAILENRPLTSRMREATRIALNWMTRTRAVSRKKSIVFFRIRP